MLLFSGEKKLDKYCGGYTLGLFVKVLTRKSSSYANIGNQV